MTVHRLLPTLPGETDLQHGRGTAGERRRLQRFHDSGLLEHFAARCEGRIIEGPFEDLWQASIVAYFAHMGKRLPQALEVEVQRDARDMTDAEIIQILRQVKPLLLGADVPRETSDAEYEDD